MAGWSRCFYAYHFCGELTKTARAELSVNSIGLALPSLGVSRSIDSVPLRVRRVHLPFCLLISSMMSCCHCIRFRLCPPCLRDTCPRHLAIMLPRPTAYSLRLIASLLISSPFRPVPRVVERSVLRLALISSCVPPAPACLPIRPASRLSSGAVADITALLLRSAATVPPPSSRFLAPLIHVGRRGDVGRSGWLRCYFVSGVICARSGDFLSVRVL